MIVHAILYKRSVDSAIVIVFGTVGIVVAIVAVRILFRSRKRIRDLANEIRS